MENPGVDEAEVAFEAAAAAFVTCVRRGLGGRESGTVAGMGCGGVDPLREQADACLDGLAESARVDAMVAAFRVRLTAGFADKAAALDAPARSPGEHSAQERAVVSEVACVLTVSERSASALLGQSHELTTTLPLTLDALQAGDLSWQHARIMVDEAANLDPAGAAAMEAHFLGPDAVNPARVCPAGELVPGRFRARARTWRERHHPVSIEKRHARSILDRRLEYTPDRDGMTWLSAYLPADQAAGIWNGITATARTLQGPTETRTLTQLRADIAAKLLLGAGISTADGTLANDVLGGDVPSPAAQVLVTVPVFALMGLTDEPAILDGYGPIPASMARNLVAEGASSFHRVLVDPRDGAPLEIGRDSYRIPPAMRRWLRLRDGKCPFPGCNNQSLDNEADHLLAWADGGTTGISNLAQPCPKHHKLKHTSSWTPGPATKDQPPGWTSPTGRHYKSEHQDWEPPHWPPQILGQLQDQGHDPRASEETVPEEPVREGAATQEAVPEEPVREGAATQEAVPEEPVREGAATREAAPQDAPREEPLPEWAVPYLNRSVPTP